jgi:hypothetical protein
MPATTIDNQYPKKEKNMNPKILDQVMRRMEAQACRTPSKGLSPARMQIRAGQRCIGCMGLLPPPHTPGVKYCTLCRPGARRHTVYVSFKRCYPDGWQCKFLEWNLITPAGKSVTFRDERLLFEMARCGGGVPYAHSLPHIAAGIKAGRGTFYLRLTDAQHEKLHSTLLVDGNTTVSDSSSHRAPAF